MSLVGMLTIPVCQHLYTWLDASQLIPIEHFAAAERSRVFNFPHYDLLRKLLKDSILPPESE